MHPRRRPTPLLSRPGDDLLDTPAHSVSLRFDPEANDLGGGKEVRDDLSALVRTGRHLWLACDEPAAVERLTLREDGSYGGHVRFRLADFLDLPGGDDGEPDLEGMAWRPPYLWIVGSHSRKRDDPDDSGEDAAERIERLVGSEVDTNRYLLARLPLREDPATGEMTPCRSIPHPCDPALEATAARLRGKGKKNRLMRALRDDPHLSPFLEIPGKDNGFDVEGLAADGARLFLGLRGPVLRGWAVVLEVEPEAAEKPGRLGLRPIGPGGRPYRKHFLDLRGLGVRELCADGDDLLVLAGPSVELDGPVRVHRWRHRRRPGEGDSIVDRGDLEVVAELPHGRGGDHAEGIETVEREDGGRALLVVYDSPAARRREPPATVLADRFDLPGR